MPVLKPITSLTCLCYFTLYPLFLLKLYARKRRRGRIYGGEKEDPIRGQSVCSIYRIALFTRYELSISRDRRKELPLAVVTNSVKLQRVFFSLLPESLPSLNSQTNSPSSLHYALHGDRSQWSRQTAPSTRSKPLSRSPISSRSSSKTSQKKEQLMSADEYFT